MSTSKDGITLTFLYNKTCTNELSQGSFPSELTGNVAFHRFWKSRSLELSFTMKKEVDIKMKIFLFRNYEICSDTR